MFYANVPKKNEPFEEEVSSDKYVFTYWEGNMPDYISLCKDTFQRCGHDIKHIHLTPHNIQEWISTEDYTWIQSYVSQYRISPAHKTDIYRIFLLHRYGGFWMDIDTIILGSLEPYFEMVNANDYVGFGATGANKMISKWKPSNWAICCKSAHQGGKFIHHCKQLMIDKIRNGVLGLLNEKENYHTIGKHLLWNALEQCRKENKDYDYVHLSNSRDCDGNWVYWKHYMSAYQYRPTLPKELSFIPLYNNKLRHETYSFQRYIIEIEHKLKKNNVTENERKNLKQKLKWLRTLSNASFSQKPFGQWTKEDIFKMKKLKEYAPWICILFYL